MILLLLMFVPVDFFIVCFMACVSLFILMGICQFANGVSNVGLAGWYLNYYHTQTFACVTYSLMLLGILAFVIFLYYATRQRA